MQQVGKSKEGKDVYATKPFYGRGIRSPKPIYFVKEPRKGGKFGFPLSFINESSVIFNNSGSLAKSPQIDYEGQLGQLKTEKAIQSGQQTNERMQNALTNNTQQDAQFQTNQAKQAVEQTNPTDNTQQQQNETQTQQNAQKKKSVSPVTAPAEIPTPQQQTALMAARTNATDGGTNAPTNRFVLPNTQGIQFGGS